MGKHTGKRNNRLFGRGWRSVALFLAVIITFSTTYALILPAITLDEETAADTPGVEVATAAPQATEKPAPEPIVITVTAAPVTPVPVTEAPVTPAPVTPVPVTEAPATPAPVVTEASVVTEAPATPAPATEAPAAPAEPVATEAPAAPAEQTQAPAVTAAPAVTPVPYPAQTLKKDIGEELYVEVKAPEGALPFGAKLVFVSSDKDVYRDETAVRNVLGDSMTSIRVYDLYFTDAGGTRIQPLKKVHVSIRHESFIGAKDELRLFYLDVNHNCEYIKLLRETVKLDEITIEFKKFNRLAIAHVAPEQDYDPAELTEEPEIVFEPETTAEPAAETPAEPATETPAEEESTAPANTDDPNVFFSEEPEDTSAPETTEAPETAEPVSETPAAEAPTSEPAEPASDNEPADNSDNNNNNVAKTEEPEVFTTEEPEAPEDTAAPEVTPEATEELDPTDDPENTEDLEETADPDAEATEVPEDYVPDEVGDALQNLVDQIAAAAEEEDPTRPAQTFEAMSNGVKLTISSPNGALPEGTEMQVEALGSDELIAAVENALPGNVKQFKTYRLHFINEGQPVTPTRVLTITAEGAFLSEAEYIAVLGHDAELNTAIITADAVDAVSAQITFEVNADSVTLAQTIEPATGLELPPEEEPQEPAGEEEVPAVTGLYYEAETNGMALSVLVPEGLLPEDAILQVDAMGSDELIAAVENALPDNVRLFKTFRVKFISGEEEIDPGRVLSITAKGELIAGAENIAVLRHDAALNTRVIHAAANPEAADTVTFAVRSGFFTIAQTNTLVEVNEIPADETALMPEQTFEQSIEGLDIRVTAPEGAFPEGTAMSVKIVTEETVLDTIKTAVEENRAEDSRITHIKAVDITFTDADGYEIQPLVPIRVSIVDTMIEASENVDVVHVDAANNATVVDQTEDETADNEVAFDADKFSVYALVGTETIIVGYMTADGDTYRITVDIPEDAGIPFGSELVVEEITEGTEAYDLYVAEIAELFGNDEGPAELTFAHLFDISFYKGTEKIQPLKEVNVKIELRKGQDLSETARVSTVHFAETGTEIIYPQTVVADEKLEAVTFDTEGFSVYAVVGTSSAFRFLTADGRTLSVDVTFDPREELPEGAVLDVSELTYEEDPAAYARRNERLAGALFDKYGNVAITDVRYLNISVMVPDGTAGEDVPTWKEYEPVYPVEVIIAYTDPMDTSNPGEYKDYNDGSTKVTPDIGNHIVGVHYTEGGAEILETVDEATDAGISETLTHTDGFSEYDFAYIYEYEIIDTNINTEFGGIKALVPNTGAETKAVGGMLRGAGDTPAHSKTLINNNDGTYKLSLTVTGDADTESNSASNANVIIVFDTSNSMINYYVAMANGARGSNNADGRDSFVLYRDTRGTEADDGYTGTVYTRTRYGNRWYYTEYTGQRYSKTIRRADAAEKVLYDFTHALYGYQNTDDPTTPDIDESQNIQTALITFNKNATTVQGWTSTENDITSRVSSTGYGGSKKLGNDSGTNWEDGLRAAQALIGTDDTENDPTFVVFITDGQPTQWHGSPTNEYDTTGRGYVEARDEARAIQVACAATGTESHGALFGIYAFGTEADYLDELMYYAYTGTARDMDPGTVATEGYYNAGDSTALAEAINDIFSKIVKTLGITAVSVSDGTTSQVQTTSGAISHLLEVDTSSFEYWLSINTVDNKFTMKDLVSGADIEYTVSSSGNNVTISWTKEETDYSATYEGTFSAGTARIKWDRATSFYNYAPPTATFTDPQVDWNLSSVGTLLDGVTYEVTFDVYPSQYTLDLIADLKNGYTQYSSLDENVREYLIKSGSDYILATNTNASISYTDTRTDDGPQTTDYTNPDPVSTSATESVSITKDWSNAIDSREKPEELQMHVTRDGTDRYTLVLNDADSWTASAFISFGIITVHNGTVTLKTTGHDYSFSEPPNMGYYWELVAPTLRPMKINGVDTLLVKVDAADAPAMSGDNATAEGTDGYTYYKLTIGGTAMYYRVDNAMASLHAENHRRSYLDVVKTVTGTNIPEGDVFPFTMTVTNSNAASGTAADLNSDYWVWFSVYDTIHGATVISDDLVSGSGVNRATDASGYTGYYYAPSGTVLTVNMQNGYSLRFLNLPSESTYTITENDIPADSSYSFVQLRKTRSYKETADGSWIVDPAYTQTITDSQSIMGTIETADAAYKVEATNKYTTVDVQLKKVDENDEVIAGSAFDLTKYSNNTWTSVQSDIKPGDTDTSTANPVDLGGLGIGRYRLTETKAPDGYVILSNHVYFEVYKETDGTLKARLTDESGAAVTSPTDTASIDGPGTGETPTYTITVTNTPGTELPNTGGEGTWKYTVAGAMLLMTALCIGCALRRRERRFDF